MSLEPAKLQSETTVRAQLRDATMASHRRAEALVGLPRTLEEHRHKLESFWGFVAPWEDLVAGALGELAEKLGSRRKAHLLRADLVALGEEAIDILPICTDLPAIDSREAALGSMYVLEGSTLGGQVLSRHAEKELGLSGGKGYLYYRSYGSEVRRMWDGFVAVLEAEIPASKIDVAIASANQTFDCLSRWFEARR